MGKERLGVREDNFDGIITPFTFAVLHGGLAHLARAQAWHV